MNSLSNWLRSIQVSNCAGCGRRLGEITRKPCPSCGSINRNIGVRAREKMGAKDKSIGNVGKEKK